MSEASPQGTLKAILLGLCPQCGQGPLFERYIAVRKSCPACGMDYSVFDPGDGPAVFGILIVGTIVSVLALWVEFTWSPPTWLHLLLWIPLICLLSFLVLRLAKSALLVLQYKHKAGEGRLK